MGLVDKLKEQAEKAKSQAQDLKDKLEEKAQEIQEEHKADALLFDLGRFLYAERTGRPISGADAQIPKFVAALKDLEDSGIAILPPPEPGQSAPAPPPSAPA
jgi:hypothetical protein